MALLEPKETPSKAMQRLKPKPKQSSLKKKNVRKSELAKMQAAAADLEMENAELKKKFDELVALVSELQAKWSNPEIHRETREDLKFDLDQDKLKIAREKARL